METGSCYLTGRGGALPGENGPPDGHLEGEIRPGQLRAAAWSCRVELGAQSQPPYTTTGVGSAAPYPGQVQVCLPAVPPEEDGGLRVGAGDGLAVDEEPDEGSQHYQHVQQPKDRGGQEPRKPTRGLLWARGKEGAKGWVTNASLLLPAHGAQTPVPASTPRPTQGHARTQCHGQLPEVSSCGATWMLAPELTYGVWLPHDAPARARGA